MAKGVTLKDVAADKFITAYAAQLKKAGQIEVPAWSGIMKTASYKDLSPYDPDWFYVRCGRCFFTPVWYRDPLLTSKLFSYH